MISESELIDLEFKGPRFTWRNNWSGEDFIMERIDMAFANSKWQELYDKALVFVEPAIGSDHNPLILNTEVPLQKVGQHFKFESFWVTEDGCKEVIVDSWNRQQEGSLMFSICKKLKELLSEIQWQMELGFNPDLFAEEGKTRHVLEDLWHKDAMFLHQRSRIKWLQLGDRNSRFFHLSTIQRMQRNQIVRLKDNQGVWRDSPREISGIVKTIFP
ncbi:hypothetical protein Vadar_019130 [Vaccinium darrowii]|uniref:Uncharacterized protein n=1 Tax=Vaccinium darrowii TaxID=229202 RepID=A0ACB7X238_9ERIC|nr:hypothetical protein Vadar_019130 [Vaccinium darrowii]